MEVHNAAIAPGALGLLVDDLPATGGTAAAGIRLIERLGRAAGGAFVIDLRDLGGRAKLGAMGQSVNTLCAFDGVQDAARHSCAPAAPRVDRERRGSQAPKPCNLFT